MSMKLSAADAASPPAAVMARPGDGLAAGDGLVLLVHMHNQVCQILCGAMDLELAR